MKVFFAGGGTGGHFYPALAIARAMVSADSRVEPFFIGAQRGIEREALPATEFPFALLDLHPLYRSDPWNNWRTIVGGIRAWRTIGQLVRTQSPVALVATGGYAAGLALAYARRSKISIVIQEQNSFPGMTVRWFAPHAKQLHLGFPEATMSLKLGPSTQVYDTGNPIEPPPESRPSRSAALQQWGFHDTTRPVILIAGGSQGARAINEAVASWVRDRGPQTAGVRVIWSTGRAAYSQYAALESGEVRVRPFIAPMSEAYAAADLAVCRAGAMTTAELTAWGVPSLLIPLPTAAADHQTANARALVMSGAAMMLAQSELTPTTLSEAIRNLSGAGDHLSTMRAAALQRARPNAAQDIARHILSMKEFK